MLRPNAVELEVLKALRELGETDVMEVGFETGLGSVKARHLCRHLTTHAYLQSQGAGYALTPAGQKALEVYGKETNPQAGNLPPRKKKPSSPGENSDFSARKVGASIPIREQKGACSGVKPREAIKAPLKKGVVLPPAKATILVHEKGGLQPPGSTWALTPQRMGVLPAGSVMILAPGEARVLPPGNVRIPLVSGVVAFR